MKKKKKPISKTSRKPTARRRATGCGARERSDRASEPGPFAVGGGRSESADSHRNERSGRSGAGGLHALLKRIYRRINAYVKDYEFYGETEDGADAYLVPDQLQKTLIYDAIHGLIADDEFTEAFVAWRAAVAGCGDKPSRHLEPPAANVRADVPEGEPHE